MSIAKGTSRELAECTIRGRRGDAEHDPARIAAAYGVAPELVHRITASGLRDGEFVHGEQIVLHHPAAGPGGEP